MKKGENEMPYADPERKRAYQREYKARLRQAKARALKPIKKKRLLPLL
jgi:hypothetical protein